MRGWLVVCVVSIGSVAVGGVPTTEKDWKAQAEAYVNGTGDDQAGNNLTEQHKTLADKCGHDITVKYDWKGFDFKTWTNGYSTVGECAGNMQLTDIADACTKGNKAAKRIKTLTCHYKACSKLPDPPSGAKGSNLKATEFQYKLTKRGANLDETFCENSANMGGSALAAFLTKQ